MTPERIAELRALAGAATPGPWGWFGNLTTHEVYLATVKRGRVYVMDFVRWGMTGAAPRFQREHIMERVDHFAVREVPYRGHFNEIDHPDARYIAAACNELPAELDEIERLREEFRAHGEVCVEGAEANAATIAELRADVERLTRELREARRVAAEIYHFIDADRDAKAMKRAGDLTRHIDSVLGAPAIRAAEGET